MDFSHLIPKFDLLYFLFFNSLHLEKSQVAGVITAAICAVLLLIFIWFGVVVVYKYFKAKFRINFYRKKLVAPIKDNKPEEILQKRRELLEIAKEGKYGIIWQEFDQSLVEKRNPSGLYNTFDAAHFFNNHTLASGLTENRLLAAVPGFLTAIGVIGTFVGLTFGLSQIELQGTPDDMKDGIIGLINGAASAFLTSVWGVATSLVFNWFEKGCERSIKKQIYFLQTEIDDIFPRIVAEQSLYNIEFINQSSHEHLAELSEKIGVEMQKVMTETSLQISQSIVESLSSALTPAIDKLVSNASEGSEKALETLINEFLHKVGNAGEQQKEAMSGATQALSQSSEKMLSNLEKFTEQLDYKIEDIRQSNHEILSKMQVLFAEQFTEFQSKQHILLQGMQSSVETITGNNQNTLKTLTDVIESFMQKLTALLAEFNQNSQSTINTINSSISEQSSAQKDELTQFMGHLSQTIETLNRNNAEMLKTTENVLTERVNAQVLQDSKRAEQINQQVELGRKAQQDLTESVKVVLEQQNQQNNSLSEQLAELLTNFKRLASANLESSESMEKAAMQINSSSNQFTHLSESLKAITNEFSLKLASTLLLTEKVLKGNQDVAQLFNQAGEKINSSSDLINQTSQNLVSTAQSTRSGFEAMQKHFEQLSIALKAHISDLNNQVSDLLTNYSQRVVDQTNVRLNEWNKQTNAYTTAMNDAMNTLNSIVDEIDGKIGRK